MTDVMVGKWDGEEVHLDDEKDAGAIAIIQYLSSANVKLNEDNGRLIIDNKRLDKENIKLVTDLVASTSSGPSIIMPGDL